MTLTAFAPAHITGFFAVRPDPDPVKAGSVGCGLCLETGVTARVTIGTTGTTDTTDTTDITGTLDTADITGSGALIRLNGEQIDLPTVEYVVESLLRAGHSRLIVDLTADVPLGYGFGVSGAAALATALAINADQGQGLTMEQAAAVAHSAEVVNRTGMGDVAGQYTGGLVIRTAAGAPGVGAVKKVPVDAMEVSWVCLGEISTSSVLDDEKTMESINILGQRALKALLKRPGLEYFISLSRDFAFDTGLVSSRAADAIEAVEAAGGLASMAMLGDTVFALGDGSALMEFGQVGSSRIGTTGAHNL
ncbi:MAG: GHMP kinase [ANME-2 cluster archaeon]|nr:GHMP kinase [ANME-2 cluster archaeon]MBC2699940.1 GHMP kinase [ANME-2 cluster archaeon]MBC2707053.1 GHMP kinase [ANME-2 cluster archaeon]MBC2746933.1 GHMP kinase [ANME-2 cluster archaeon]MBC2761996.1 GHMP kinase [ANME-2 cluster archaeon]